MFKDLTYIDALVAGFVVLIGIPICVKVLGLGLNQSGIVLIPIAVLLGFLARLVRLLIIKRSERNGLKQK